MNVNQGQELSALERMGRAELVRCWSEQFAGPVPRKAGASFLRMAIAWKLQARGKAATVSRLQRRLAQMAATLDGGRKPRVLKEGPRAHPGVTLLRSWRGRDYAVTVTEGGFLFEGRRYGSLSEIAREITGTRWNGPSFFGLRVARSGKAERRSRHE